ncbi:UNVERIFIED_CONTAM: hypothetical protein Slati_2126900 [Sesamum latifolium]|uniref:Uncharacterized protein n=1 Tax=Sesamum latifolium TaxID=2727402 RepID=A0AAW2WQE8_9LAMI
MSGYWGHFGLSPHVEPLDKPLAGIMFKKYFRDLSDKEKEKGGALLLLVLLEGPLPPVPPRERDLCLPPGGRLLRVLPRGPGPVRRGSRL